MEHQCAIPNGTNHNQLICELCKQEPAFTFILNIGWICNHCLRQCFI